MPCVVNGILYKNLHTQATGLWQKIQGRHRTLMSDGDRAMSKRPDLSIVPITDDLLKYFAWKATACFGHKVQFSSASFSHVLRDEIGFTKLPDGLFVKMILTGRPWLKHSPAYSAHWEIIPNKL